MAEPTAYSQYMLELINHARLAPAEAANSLGIDLNEGLEANTISDTPKQPLAFNPLLIDAANFHSQWMLDTDTFDHAGIGGDRASDRILDAGYQFNTWGENIGYTGTTGTLNLNSATEKVHQSLFKSSGHRRNILRDNFRELGLATIAGDFTGYNSLMVTQNYATSSSTPFLTGVVFNDELEDNDFYSVGEGLAGIEVTATLQSSGASFTTDTMSAGGYQLALDPGTYDVTFTVNDQSHTSEVTVDSSNLKLDLNIEDLASLDGNDLLVGDENDNFIQGEIGDDTIYGDRGNDTLEGNQDNDRLFGGWGDDVVSGGNGNDFLYLGIDNDFAAGDDGNDYIQGEWGDDTVYGGNGNDTLNGNQNSDRLFGGWGDDVVSGGNGNDFLYLGIDNDFAAGDDGNDYIQGEWGDDTVYGGNGNDTLNGNQNSDRLFGGWGDDVVSGGNGNDWLYLGIDNDFATGGAGDDYIQGEWGDDTIAGGAGADTLQGNQNNDIFVYNRPTDSSVDRPDVITDFTVGADKLQLDFLRPSTTDLIGEFQVSSIYPYALVSNLAEANASFSGFASSRLAFSAAESMLYVDSSAQGFADMAIELENVTNLSPADFV